MYGDISNLKKSHVVFDEIKMKQLGLEDLGIPRSSAIMRYTAGCIKRERERLAKIFIQHKKPEEIAQAILDESLDDYVFQWKGPEITLGG